MKLFAITYDLRHPGRNYQELYDSIKLVAESDNWQHPMESYWVIAVSELSTYDANSLYEIFRQHIDDNDSLIVMRMDQSDRQGWMPKSFWEWVKDKSARL